MKYHPAPPPAPRAIPADDVPRIDLMSNMGFKHCAIAKSLGVHPRTVHNILHRKGAYAGVPK